MANTQKYVYSFGGGSAEGRAEMKELLGGKGANLAEMSLIGIPVPPGFTITTEVCAAYYDRDRKLPEEVKPQVEAALVADGGGRRQEVRRPADPLLVSVRSGAALSMPGMMNTILNLGLTDASVEGLAKKTGNSAVRLRRLSPRSSTCSARRPWTSSTSSSSTSSTRSRKSAASSSTPT